MFLRYKDALHSSSFLLYFQLYPPNQDDLLYVFPGKTSGFPLDCQKYNRYSLSLFNCLCGPLESDFRSDFHRAESLSKLPPF